MVPNIYVLQVGRTWIYIFYHNFYLYSFQLSHFLLYYFFLHTTLSYEGVTKSDSKLNIFRYIIQQLEISSLIHLIDFPFTSHRFTNNVSIVSPVRYTPLMIFKNLCNNNICGSDADIQFPDHNIIASTIAVRLNQWWQNRGACAKRGGLDDYKWYIASLRLLSLLK